MGNCTWKENMQALGETLPSLCNYIEENREEEQKILVKQAFNGEKILTIVHDEKEYYLGGLYNPQEHAEWKATRLKETGFGSIVIVIGFSDGRLIRELLKKAVKETLFLMYEPSMDVFCKAMQNFELADILGNERLGLFVENFNGHEWNGVLEKTILVENRTKVQIVISGNYYQLFPQKTKEVCDAIKKHIGTMQVNWNTMVNFTNDTGKNIVTNLKYFYQHYTLIRLFDKLPEGVPVIVVASGPSLDKNIEQLKKAVGHACIIACDTSLKPLLQRDIVPDFFVVVDPRKPLELFENPKTSEIPMISGLNIPIGVMDAHTGKKIIYYDTPLLSEVMKYALDRPITYERGVTIVPTGGSVATSAFSIGRMMGAKTIILVGQDLALTGEKEHVEGAFKKDREFDLTDPRWPKVEGIDGQMYPTLANLKFYLTWFEDQIKMHPDLQVVDATEGGALIHGSEVMTLEEALNTYCTNDFSSRELMEELPLHFTEEEQRRVLEYFAGLPMEIKQIKEKVKKGIREYKRLEKTAKAKRGDKKELQKIYKRISNINQWMERNAYACTIMESIRGVEYTLRSSMYDMKTDAWEDIGESAKIGRIFLESMELAVKEMAPLYQELSKFKGEYKTDSISEGNLNADSK